MQVEQAAAFVVLQPDAVDRVQGRHAGAGAILMKEDGGIARNRATAHCAPPPADITSVSPEREIDRQATAGRLIKDCSITRWVGVT